MSKRSKSKAAPPAELPKTGGSFVLGADGKLVANTDAVVTRPNPGKSVLEAEASSKRTKTPANEPLTPSEPGDVDQPNEV